MSCDESESSDVVNIGVLDESEIAVYLEASSAKTIWLGVALKDVCLCGSKPIVRERVPFKSPEIETITSGQAANGVVTKLGVTEADTIITARRIWCVNLCVMTERQTVDSFGFESRTESLKVESGSARRGNARDIVPKETQLQNSSCVSNVERIPSFNISVTGRGIAASSKEIGYGSSESDNHGSLVFKSD